MASLSWVSLFTNQDVTRSSFITNFRSRIDEDTADIVTDVQIQEWIRQGGDDISFQTQLLPEYAEVSANGDTSYTLPTTMVNLKSLWHISSDATPVHTLIRPKNLLEIYDKGYDNSTMKYFVRNGNSVEIFGSTGVTSGTVRAYGVRLITFPATDSAYIDLPRQYIELMYLWCRWMYFLRRRSDDEAIIAQRMYERRIEMVRADVMKQFDPGTNAYG